MVDQVQGGFKHNNGVIFTAASNNTVTRGEEKKKKSLVSWNLKWLLCKMTKINI